MSQKRFWILKLETWISNFFHIKSMKMSQHFLGTFVTFNIYFFSQTSRLDGWTVTVCKSFSSIFYLILPAASLNLSRIQKCIFCWTDEVEKRKKESFFGLFNFTLFMNGVKSRALMLCLFRAHTDHFSRSKSFSLIDWKALQQTNDERTDEQTNKRTNKQTNKRTNEQTNKRTNEQMNDQTK
jgi:hypothetical protein